MNLLDTQQFTARFEDLKPINPMFSHCKIYTLYTGTNRNNSFISKETTDKAIPSLYNIPIVGEFLEHKDNFGGHGGKIEITDKGINYVVTTIPYGLIPESANIYWEKVTENDGTVNEYLVIDNAILWTGRYSDLDELLNQKFGQSMEIDINEGSFTKINNVDTYEIRDFTFSALCILGVDKDGEGHVEPCFESASISTYSLDKDKFKAEFSQMIKELKFSLQHNVVDVAKELQEGGNKIVPENILALLQQYSLTENDLIEKGIAYAEFSIEDLEVKINETFQKEVVVETETPKEFALTSKQLEDELRRELAGIETLTEVYWDEIYTSPRFYYRDCKPEQNTVIAMDDKNRYLVGLTYSTQGDSVEIDASTCVRYKFDYMPMDLNGEVDSDETLIDTMSLAKSEFMLQAKEKELNKQFEVTKEQIQNESQLAIEKLQTEFAELQQKYTDLEDKANQFESELSSKAQQERIDAESEIFESFSIELTEEEMKPVKEKASTLSLEDITEKLFSIAGKKKVKFSLKESGKSLSFQIPLEEKHSTGKAYDELFEKFNKKNEE